MRSSEGQRILAAPRRGQALASLLILGVHVRSPLIISTSLLFLLGCGSSGGSPPGPIVDNTKWRPTDKGEEFFGPSPPTTCPPPEGDCPDLGGDECVDVPSGCVVSYVAECSPPLTPLSVYTDVCDWVTLEQPSLRAIRAGDEIEIRTNHSDLTGPVGGEARISVTLGDEMIFDELVAIPQPSAFINRPWIATADFEAGTPMLFHVNNHGRDNEYSLLEVNICQDRPLGGGDDDVLCVP